MLITASAIVILRVYRQRREQADAQARAADGVIQEAKTESGPLRILHRYIRLHATQVLDGAVVEVAAFAALTLVRGTPLLDAIAGDLFARMHCIRRAGAAARWVLLRAKAFFLFMRLGPALAACALRRQRGASSEGSCYEARIPGGGARPLLAAALQAGLDAAVVTHAKLTAIHLVQGSLGLQHARAAEEVVPISGRVRPELRPNTCLERLLYRGASDGSEPAAWALDELAEAAVAPGTRPTLLSKADPAGPRFMRLTRALWAGTQRAVQSCGESVASRFEKHWEGRSLSASIVRSVEPAGAAGEAGEAPAPRFGILADDPSGAATCRALMVVQGTGDSPAGIAHELAHVVCRHAAEQVDSGYESHLRAWLRAAAATLLRPRLLGATGGSSTGSVAGAPACGPWDAALLAAAGVLYAKGMDAVGADIHAGGSLGLALLHEMEAEQVGLLLMSMSGASPLARIAEQPDVLAVLRDWGEGDTERGTQRLCEVEPGAFNAITAGERRSGRLDAEKRAWAAAQVLHDSLSIFHRVSAEAASARAAAAAAADAGRGGR